MNILLCNDDGIDCPGLKQLLEHLSTIADVYVVAPESEKSAYSHKLTISGRIKIEERELEHAKKAYALYGSPADCVYSALTFLIDEKIDLVVSGINRGANVSTDIIYSGTVAAARQAFLLEVPAMAVSLCDYHPESYHEAAKVTKDIVLKYMEIEDKSDYFINVNIPYLNKEDIKGTLICDESAYIKYNDELAIEDDYDGSRYLVMKNIDRYVRCDRNNLKIDLVAVENGYISISPLYDNQINKDKIKTIEVLKN